MPERCSPARVRYAAPDIGALLPRCAPFQAKAITMGGSGGNTIRAEIRFYEPDTISA